MRAVRVARWGEVHDFRVVPCSGLAIEVCVWESDGAEDDFDADRLNGKVVLALDSIFQRAAGDYSEKDYNILKPGTKKAVVHGAVKLGFGWTPPQLESEVGAPLVLLLRSRDRFGNAQSGGGDAWEARLVGGEAGADTEPPSVADHGDGTYALTLLSRSAGLFSLEVRLCSAGRLYAPFTCIVKAVDSRACDRLLVPN